MNVGVYDRECDWLCWGVQERPISEADCVFVERIGFILGGNDLWWKLDEEPTPHQVAQSAERHALPLLERLKTREAIADAVETHRSFGWSYPLPKIRLAALRALIGERAEALRLLNEVQAGGGDWAQRTLEVERRISAA